MEEQQEKQENNKWVSIIVGLLQTMDSIVPIQYINQHFRTPIKQLQQSGRSPNATFFTAVTAYGSMCLVVENYTKNVGGIDTIHFLQCRNRLIGSNSSCFPAIYQQNICVNHPQQIACISLIQTARYVREITNNHKIRITNLKKLANCMCLLQKHELTMQEPLEHKDLLYLPNQQQIGIDFTRIVPADTKQNNRILQQFLNCIQLLLPTLEQQQNQIILVQDKLYMFDPSLLKQATDFQEVLFMLNLCPNLNVEIELKTLIKQKSSQQVSESPSKIRRKLVKVEELQGKQKFNIGSKEYTNLIFVEGKCMNSFRQLGQDEQKLTIFKKKCHLRIKKREVLYLQAVQEQVEEDIITVEQGVQKIEFISFVICYLKIRQPVINSIKYDPRKNSLKIEHSNKMKQDRTLKIYFYADYLVKDEEISMIVERAKLKNCKLDLRSMKINDSLLMFLANSQKTSKIGEIHISDCYGITDNGINALVMSPFCKKMQALTLVLDGNLFPPSIQSLSLRQQLKKLHLEHNKQLQYHQHDVQVNLQQLKIAELCSVGIKVPLDGLNLQNLKVLKISQPVHIDQLKLLRNSQLTQLRIRLIELSKKNIIESTSSFLTGALINRNNPVRAFAEGSSSKTLKILELSTSSVKFKSLKYLFNMPELEKLVLNDCTHLGHQFEPISPKILHLSLIGTQISITNLSELLDKTSIMVEINLTGNKVISRQDLVKYIESKKKFINNLLVCENCYSHKLIEKMGGNSSNNGFELVENVGLSVGKLANEEKEDILFDILGKVMQTPKILKLLTDSNYSNLQKLIHQIERFMKGSGKSKKHFKNLYINHLRFTEALEKQIKRATLFDPTNKQEITNKNSSLIKIPQSFTIEQLTYKIRTLPPTIQSLGVDLTDNRIIGKECMKMLSEEVQSKLTQINFMNCIFSFHEVIEYLFEFPQLSMVNGGVCSLRMDGGNFSTYSHQYLKFFMKLTKITQLSITCNHIEETELLYSVLYHVLDKHSDTLTKLSVQLVGQTVNNDGEIFVTKIFDLVNLKQLTLEFTNCHLLNINKKENCLDGLNQLSQLRKLTLKLNMLAPNLTLKNLQEVSISYSGSQIINEQEISKMIKNLFWSPIKKLDLDFSQCPSVTNLNKVFSLGPSSTLFEKLQSLQHFRLNLEYCSLKQNSFYEVLHSLTKCPRIKKIELNVSFMITNLNELVNKIHTMITNIGREIKVHVISVTPTSAQYNYNRSYFEANGVTFTF